MSSRPVPIDALIEDLQSDSPVRREAALARLRVLGAPALPRLGTVLRSSAPVRARVLALSALEGLADPRAMAMALAQLESPDRDIVIAALNVLRPWVAREGGTRLLETIASIAVDTSCDARVRVAAVDALSDLPDHLVGPVRAQVPPPENTGPSLEDPASAAEWIRAHGDRASLSALHDAVVAFRDRERDTALSERRGWLEARALAHGTLARRGSRLALYDAQETMASARDPLPSGFLEALARRGEAECLESLAAAWSRSKDGQWRSQLSETGLRLMRRLRLTGRHAVVRKIRAAHGGFL